MKKLWLGIFGFGIAGTVLSVGLGAVILVEQGSRLSVAEVALSSQAKRIEALEAVVLARFSSERRIAFDKDKGEPR